MDKPEIKEFHAKGMEPKTRKPQTKEFDKISTWKN